MHKIRIAPDAARMRQMPRQIVAGPASQICEAGDGAAAVALCAAQRPDWALMYRRMKPLDGLRATAQTKARFPETRIEPLSRLGAQIDKEAKRQETK